MNSSILKSVIWVIKHNILQTVLTVAVIAAAVVSALIPPLVLERIINILSGDNLVYPALALGYLAVFAISGIIESLQNITITRMGQKITHQLRSMMSVKLEHLPASYFTCNETGQITSRFVNDVDAVDSLFTNGIISMFADAFKVVSIMVIIFIKSRGLGLIMCIATPLLMVMTIFFQKRMQRAQQKNRQAVARVNHHVPETIENIRMIHNFSCEQYMENKYDNYIQQGYDAMNKSNFYDAIYSPIIIWVSALVIAIMMVGSTLGTGISQLFSITVGSAVAIIAYVGKVFEPLESIGMEIQNIQSAVAGVKRIDSFLAEKEIETGIHAASNDIINTYSKSQIEFEHVWFAYEDGKNILTDSSFTISQGEAALITGRTGAGKSTIFRLILGLYTPNRGRVLINGIDASHIASEDKRKLFGYVKQHFDIIQGSVREQISMYDENISDEDVWKALEMCGLAGKIRNMPHTIYTTMSVSDFSQGELQLMSIARAMVSNPAIILLDEMTANLDSITEERITNVLKNAVRGRTVISISHRLTGKERGKIIQLPS